MKIAIGTVVRVTGKCKAGYSRSDKIIVNLDNACVDKERSDHLCVFALGAILANMSRIEQGETILTSCPDPATGLGGNVIFHVVKGELSNDSSSGSK